MQFRLNCHKSLCRLCFSLPICESNGLFRTAMSPQMTFGTTKTKANGFCFAGDPPESISKIARLN